MALISLVINCDTRPENNSFGGSNLMGVCNEDFLWEGILNKIDFFKGFDIEVVVYVDEHLPLKEYHFDFLQEKSDVFIVRKHTNEPSFNCYNYVRALSMASGDIICHVDQDTNCFTSSPKYVQQLIDWCNDYAFVSYPSHCSPKPAHDESFGKRTWASTRFFMCKKDKIRIDELKDIVAEPEIGYTKYGNSPRRCNWLEHFLTLTNNDSCFYPPHEEGYMIFSWDRYVGGVLNAMNKWTYEQCREYVINCGGVHYPCDVTAQTGEIIKI